MGGRRMTPNTAPDGASRPQRFLRIVALVSLALAGCGEQGAPPVASPSPPPLATSAPSIATSPSEGTVEPPILLPFPGAPPIWTLSVAETDRIVGGVIHRFMPSWAPAYAAVDEACATIEKGPPGGDFIEGNSEVDDCLRPYLEGLGVASEALDLFFASGIAIWDAEATGPFWLAEGFDYDMLGSNGVPPDYLFTPAGMFDIPGQFTSFFPPKGWAPLLTAIDTATASEPMPAIRRAYATYLGERVKDVWFWAYGEYVDLAPARETGSGWAIPLEMHLVGCHVCATPIVGRFEVTADPAGAISGVRFIDLCYDPKLAPDDPTALPGGSGRFGLPDCTG